MSSVYAASATGAVDRYVDLDVSEGSPAGQALLARVQQEAANAHLHLTEAGDEGALSRGLTPAMNEWVMTRVAPVRGQALSELEAQARAIKISNNVDGILLEAEQDRVERHCARRRQDIIGKFNRDNKQLLERCGRLNDEYNRIRAEEGGRDAKTPNKWVEFGVLIPVVMIPEAMLNFESFRRAPIIQSDAMALGATLLVGFGIAAAAYCIGLYIRQFNYFAHPDSDERQISGWPLYTWGSSALFVSLGSVAVARHYYLLPRIQEAIVLGGPIPNIPVSIGSLLFGNLICFLVGAIITFFLNDPNPAYADVAENLNKAQRKVDGLKKRRITAQLDQIDHSLKLGREAAKRKHDQMSGRPGFTQLRERFDRLLAKDAEVVGALQAYRMALVQANPHIAFAQHVHSADNADPTRPVTADAFASMQLQLGRSLA